MYYEINVSKNGKHFFATHERSLTNLIKTSAALEVFRKVFPSEEGYDLRVTRYETHGYEVAFTE